MSIIVTRPEHDPTTYYLSQWAKQIIELAKKKGVTIVDLHKNKATRKEFEGRLKKLKLSLVFLNGHGSNNCVTGHNNEILVKANENEITLKDKITYALSCNSANELGKKVATYTNSAYIGYKDEFVFIIDRKCISNPLVDKRAKPFMEASNQVVMSLLKGNTAEESCKRSKEVFEKSYTKLLASTSDQDALQSAQYLWWNRKNQACLGDREMKFIDK